MLTKSFIKIKSLNEDLFVHTTFKLLTIVRKFSQFLNIESLDFFISGHWEIELAFQNIKRELDKFTDELEKIF